MFWTSVKRIFSTGFINFWRNGIVSLSSVMIMSITLFVVGSLIFTAAILNTSLTQLQSKVDVNVYLKPGAEKQKVVDLQEKVESLSEVESTELISRESALAEFRSRHEDDPSILEALEEVGKNPLGANLAITAQETSQYESITNFLNENYEVDSGDSIIDRINFSQNEQAINRLTEVIESTERLGIAIIGVLAVLSILIMFNTTRLAIHTSRDEIAVMQLVGANDSYIRGPFIVEGMMHGLAATIISLAVLHPLTMWLGPATESFFGSINVFDYYINNFGEIFFLLLGCGLFLGGFSSYLAVRRYLKL